MESDNAERAHPDQSEFVAIFFSPGTESTDNKGNVSILIKENIQNKIEPKLPFVPCRPLYLSIIPQRLSLSSDRGQREIQLVLQLRYLQHNS